MRVFSAGIVAWSGIGKERKSRPGGGSEDGTVVNPIAALPRRAVRSTTWVPGLQSGRLARAPARFNLPALRFRGRRHAWRTARAPAASCEASVGLSRGSARPVGCSPPCIQEHGATTAGPITGVLLRAGRGHPMRAVAGRQTFPSRAHSRSPQGRPRQVHRKIRAEKRETKPSHWPGARLV